MVKQVIVMRTDLGMRKGKMIAQGAHASIKWLVDRMKQKKVIFTAAESEWMQGAFTKICVQVGSEKELFEIYEKAKQAELDPSLIIDAGKTEFNGEPTPTCLAIGPCEAELVDKITGHLKLL